MIYTQTYINQVLSKAYCCMGTMGIDIDKSLRYNIDSFNKTENLSILYLYAWTLYSWIQSEDGLTISEDNVITEEEKDTIIERILSLCCCEDDVTTTEIITLDSDYWDNGYTEDDDGADSYNG